MSERTLFLGLDPGQSGGLAIVDSGGLVVDASPMPETVKDLSDYLAEFGPRIQMATLESVHAMPQQGVSSSFKFGVNYGQLHMGLVAHNIPFANVSPQLWQKVMGCIVKGRSGPSDAKRAKKNGTKARAQELFPGTKCTHAISDALLLAEYCRRVTR